MFDCHVSRSKEHNTYRTKCWKIYLSIEKLTGGSLFKSPRNANNLQLRSVFTSILNAVDDGPPRVAMDAVKRTKKEKCV